VPVTGRSVAIPSMPTAPEIALGERRHHRPRTDQDGVTWRRLTASATAMSKVVRSDQSRRGFSRSWHATRGDEPATRTEVVRTADELRSAEHTPGMAE
jgi:hypothetical protein